mmetsp:Transcript_15993/g.23706  ORF Transcript_15993/g.23706 Transcript_15993/m.23706 type:complete len:115 (+) Transcript_15993:1505-1849(+)
MPLKITKEMTTHLIKYVRNVNISFNPIDQRTKSARELLRQVQAPRYTESNPKLKINVEVRNTVEPPSVVFQFVDDSEMKFESMKYKTRDIMFDVFLYSMNLDTTYELQGKSLDD